MPANQFLIVGGGSDFIPAESCPAGEKRYGNGLYWPHQGDADRFMAAEATVKNDGTAGIWLAVWRCVYCDTLVVGIGKGAQVAETELTFLQEAP